MEQSHSAATLTEAKKLMLVIPVSAFRLLLQALLQPIIKLKGWPVQHITKMPKPKGFSFMDMLPNSSESHNLLQAAWIFAVALSLFIKEEYGVKASIHGVSSLLDVLEKQLCQAVKGVKYESGWQKKISKTSATEVTPEWFKLRKADSDTLESRSSSSNDDKGASARRHRRQKKSKKSSSKWPSDAQSLNTEINFELCIQVNFQCSWCINSVYPLALYTIYFLTQPYSKFSIPCSLYTFGLPLKIKLHTYSKLQIILASKCHFFALKNIMKVSKETKRKQNTII